MKHYDNICTVCGAYKFLPFGQRSDGIRVLQCGECGHGIVEQFQDDVKSLYGAGYFSAPPDCPVGYSDYASAADQGVAWAASLVRILKSGGDVLDIGCANGRALQLLGDGYNRFGIELNEDMAQQAEQAGARIIARDLLDSRVKEIYAGSFDAVLAIAVFEHIPDFGEAFRTATSLLKPDGVLVFELPLIQAAGDVWYRSSLEHLHYPTRSSIEYLFREILHLSLTGSVIDVQDFGSIYVGLTSPDVETARLAGAEYLRLTSAGPASLCGEEIRFRWYFDLMHFGRSRPEILALYRHLKPEDWNAFTLRRLFDLWAFREEKLKHIEAYLAEVEKARDWHAERAAALDQARTHGEETIAELRQRLRDAESARDEYAAQLDAIRTHLEESLT
jgi:SAM-dependent methyltransferase